jgi:hypothetical protein
MKPLLKPARYNAPTGCRGSGKSHFFAGLVIRDCLAEVNTARPGELSAAFHSLSQTGTGPSSIPPFRAVRSGFSQPALGQVFAAVDRTELLS